MVKRFLTKKIFHIFTIFLAIIFGVCIGSFVFFLFSNNKAKHQEDSSYTAGDAVSISKIVFDSCQKEPEPSNCYERDIPKLTNTLSMQEAFEVVSGIYEMDPSYKYCHTLGHALASREVQKDPSKWKEVISACPVGVCSRSCTHGVIDEIWRSNDLWKDLDESQQKDLKVILKDACSNLFNSSNAVPAQNCISNIGHISFFLTQDPNESFELCEEIYNGSSEQVEYCYSGIFRLLMDPQEEDEKVMVGAMVLDDVGYKRFCSKLNALRKKVCLGTGDLIFSTSKTSNKKN